MSTEPTTTKPQSAAVGPMVWAGIFGVTLFFALMVGAGVYFYMASASARTVDAKVKARVDEQMAAMAQAPQGPPPASVKVAQVGQRVAQQRIKVVGRLMEVKRSTVASEVEGKVLELLAPAGRDVVGGETVIARVDPVWSQLAVEQAQADLAAAKANAKKSAKDLELITLLHDRGSTDYQELIDAQGTADADAASVIALEAALHRAQESRARVEIIAPFDGTVSRKLVEKGMWLDPGTAVVEVVSRGLIDAVIDVPEQHISSLEKGTPIEITVVPLNETIQGQVQAINPDGSNSARTFSVKVRFDDQAGRYKVGMSVTARVPVRAQAEYLMVPRDAVQYAVDGPEVWMSLVMPGSAPGSMPQGLPMPVDVVFGDGDFFAVVPKPKIQGMDLFPGMDIVIEGAERLWPTRPLMVTNQPGDAPERNE